MPRRLVYSIIDVMGFIIDQQWTRGFHDVYEVKKLLNNQHGLYELCQILDILHALGYKNSLKMPIGGNQNS